MHSDLISGSDTLASKLAGDNNACAILLRNAVARMSTARYASGMLRFSDAPSAWGTDQFEAVLKHEIERLPVGALPLQGGLSSSSYVLDGTITAMVIDARELDGRVRTKVGIFYSGILGGCACADDPTPVNENSEYCVVQFDIDRATGEAEATLLEE